MAQEGRPPFKWTEEMEEHIWMRLRAGDSLKEALASRDDLPSDYTFYKRKCSDPQFASAYARAREDQWDMLADDIISIARSASTVSSEEIQKAKLVVDAMKWTASKRAPRQFGESATMRHANADGSNLDLVAALQAIDGKTAGLPKDDA
jgi:hypothetical protein